MRNRLLSKSASKSALSALLAAALLCLAALPAQAQQADRETEIRQLLDQRDRQIKAILGASGSFTDAQRAKLKTLVSGLIDFRAMGKEALGPYWRDISYDQQTTFVGVFGDIVKEQSLADLEPYRAPVSYQEIRVNGDDAYVKTTSVQKGERIPVEYDLVYRDGEWRARDIVVDEVSTVDGYKRSFRRQIQRRGFDGLMKGLRNKLKKVQSS